MKALVGYTGFVGSNIAAKADFDGLYNSKNISEAYGTKPELLVYSGVRAEKFLANNSPKEDYKNIIEAFENIEKIEPERLVLISTVDVFKEPNGKDEDSLPETENLHAYGYNRLILEKKVREKYSDALIVRLPGLFGKNLKKNFIFDMIQLYPSMLNEEKYNTYCNEEIKKFYIKQENGFYKCTAQNDEEKLLLKNYFSGSPFNALSFTDSRGLYQFYPLDLLWGHIQTALENDLKLVHMAVEPVCVSDVFKYVRGSEFNNEILDNPPCYDFRTKYSELLGSHDGYILSAQEVLERIKNFIDGVEKQ